MSINFRALKTSIKLRNFKTGEEGVLIPLDGNAEISKQDLQQITRICSSPKVFNMLFADLEAFKGRKYNIDDAKFFVNEKSKKEWKEKKAFVYLVRNSNNQIVCAVDIKSANCSGAEIGYWADPTNPGWMTNAVLALLQIAKKAGYKMLFALVRKDNKSSKGVLLRSGFKKVGTEPHKGRTYDRYEIKLN